MTCIVSEGMTKAQFKKLVHKQAVVSLHAPIIIDPSYGAPYHGSISKHPALQQAGGAICVTNDPKRSWFASVTRKGDILVVA